MCQLALLGGTGKGLLMELKRYKINSFWEEEVIWLWMLTLACNFQVKRQETIKLKKGSATLEQQTKLQSQMWQTLCWRHWRVMSMTGKELQLLDCKVVRNYKELKKMIQNFILKKYRLLKEKAQDRIMFEFNRLLIKQYMKLSRHWHWLAP